MTQGEGRLIAVASGKGGVGKTWLAITLAHAMARAGRRVLLFDADLGLANIDLQLGLVPRRDLASAYAAGADPLSAAAAYAPGGFDVVAGRSGAPALAALPGSVLEQLVGGLRAAAGRYDVILLDLAAGIDRPTRRLAACADTLLLVAADEPTSLADAYAVLKLHVADRGGADRRVVVNQAPTHAAGERCHATLARAAESFLGFTPPLAGVVRRDDRVREAIRRQTLLLTRSPGCPAASDAELVAADCATVFC